MACLKLIVLFALLGLVMGQAPQGNGIDGDFFTLPRDDIDGDPGSPGRTESVPMSCRRLPTRNLTGQCTHRITPEFGEAGRVHFSYFNVDSPQFLETRLKSPRVISNLVAAQDGDSFNQRDLNELTTFFGQFLDHNIVSTPLTEDEEKETESDLGDEEPLPFRRSLRAQFGEGGTERPVNSLPSAVDLIAVYCNNIPRNKGLRVTNACILRTPAANLLPFNTGRLSNSPTNGSEFYVAGDTRSNEHPILTALHTLWMREHNRLCES